MDIPEFYQYDYSADYSQYTRLLLIDGNSVQNQIFATSAKSNTYALSYDSSHDPTELKKFITTKLMFVTRIAVISHGPANVTKTFYTPDFIGRQPFFTDSDLANNAPSFSVNVQLLKDLVFALSLTRIDFLGCNLLRLEKWKKYFEILKLNAPSLIIGASSDNTGNLKYGGNWTMENTNDNIKNEYFTNAIGNYAGLLLSTTETVSGRTYTFTYTVGVPTCKITAIDDKSGAVVLPNTLHDGDGNAYSVTATSVQLFALDTTVTSIVLPSTLLSIATKFAFYASNLTSVTFDGTPNVTTINDSAFHESGITSFTIPASVTTIGAAILASTNITTLTIPDTVVGTIKSTIYACNKIVSFFIGTGVTIVNTYTVYNNPKLETVHFGKNAVVYGDNLKYLPKLKKVTFSSLYNTYGYNHNTWQLGNTFNYSTLKVCIVDVNTGDEYMYSGSMTSKNDAHTAGSAYGATHGSDGAVAIASGDYKKISSTPSITLVDGKIELTSLAPGIDLTDTSIVGTNTVDKRKYVFNQMTKIFDTYDASLNETGSNKMTFKNITLPGFDKTFTTLKAFNIKTDNFEIPSNEFSRGGDYYFAVRTIGHSVKFPVSEANPPTFDVIVRTGESTYTLNGVSYNSGDTATVGDITYNFGSTQASVSDIKKLDFILTAFDTSMVLTKAGELGDLSFSLTTDATITLDTDVSNELLRNTFFYRTDDVILADGSFVAFFVDDTAFTNMQSTMNPKNGKIKTTSDGAYVADDVISKDFLRDLARQLFGTYLGADLFTNEDSVATNINSKCDVVAANIMTKMQNVNISSTANVHLDSSLNYYFLKDDPSNLNICREIVTQMITQDTERFQDISGLSYSNTYDGYWKVPFQAGDVLKYKLTVTPASNQVTAIDTGSGAMTPRTYTVKLNVV